VVLDRGRVVATQYIPVPPSLPPAGAGGETEYRTHPWVAGVAARVRYVLESLRYERGLSVDRLYLCGGRSEDSEADWQLSQQLDLAVTRLLVGGEGGSAEYAVAYGCALQAAGVAPTPLNLTPAAVSMEREVVQRRQSRLSWISLATAGALALLFVYGALVLEARKKLDRVVQREREVARITVGQAPDPKDLETKKQAVEAAATARVPPSQILKSLSEHLPRGAWIAELTYNAATGCVVRGYSIQPDAAQLTQIGLLRQELFDEVTLDYRNEETIEKVPVWAFQLTCRLRPPEPTRRTGTRRASR